MMTRESTAFTWIPDLSAALTGLAAEVAPGISLRPFTPLAVKRLRLAARGLRHRRQSLVRGGRVRGHAPGGDIVASATCRT